LLGDRPGAVTREPRFAIHIPDASVRGFISGLAQSAPRRVFRPVVVSRIESSRGSSIEIETFDSTFDRQKPLQFRQFLAFRSISEHPTVSSEPRGIFPSILAFLPLSE
jgi:hypothetical protein